MSTDKESSAAGTDNRPAMLVQSDYESWKIRIERYIRGKPLGKLIWRLIQNGPTPHPQITVTEGQGAAAIQVTREKTDEEFTVIENNRELADIQATNILSQGLPRHVFNILNQTCSGKEIWDNVELLMKGSRKSLQQKKEKLFDEYERFHEHQVCKQPSSLLGKSSSIVDPLAYLASITHHLTPTQPTNPLLSTSSLTLPPQPAAQSSNDAMLATMNQIVNLLSGFQKQFPPTNNQLRTSSNSRSHATMHDGQIVTETIQRKAVGNVDEGPHAAAAFMVHTDDNQIFDNVNHLLAHEMHQEEHLDSDVESDIDDNMIPYHQYQFDSEVQDVPTEVSSMSPGEISEITILDELRNQLDGHLKVNQEQSMVNDSLRAELARCKLEIQTLKRDKVKHNLDMTIVQRNKRNAKLEQENVLLNSNISQKVKSINSLITKSKKFCLKRRSLRKGALKK
nr:hypothetical protein [Tanacetum cinerariifolium]